ncbi:MAG TPA: DUF4382 domain-containing protein [Bacteroidia bacterium]
MKTTIKIILTSLIVILISFGIISCKKDKPGESRMTLQMTDAPADYLAVNVEIVGASVHLVNEGWVDVPVTTGVYNLLTLQNDVTATLAPNVSIPLGRVNQMRLHIGTNNSIVTANGTYGLKIPSGEESGIKINLNEDFLDHQHTFIVLDFDARASVVENGNNSYSLKPVIKIKSITHTNI